jgi:hypothetical protein
LQLRESAGAEGELIEEENREDDPADGEESVADAETRCQNGQLDRHVKDGECDSESGGEAEQGGDVSFDAQAGHRYEKNDQWERGKCCGEQPEVSGVVALRPGGCEVWRSFEDDGSNDQDDYGEEERDRVAFAAWGGCWRSEGRLFGQDRRRNCRLKRMPPCWFFGVAIAIWSVDRVFDENLADQRRWLQYEWERNFCKPREVKFLLRHKWKRVWAWAFSVGRLP